MTQDARRDEEAATRRRAQILGLDYFDTSQQTQAQKILYPDLMTVQELYQLRVIPLQHRVS